ncbi:MAG: hypothetical protein QOH26_1579 [Actinomycetota bacterium]|nr:hypothetical protein [Actinomycetota bacterium]
MADLKIRDADDSDAPRIADLYVELKEHHGRIQPGNPRYLVERSDWLAQTKRAIEDAGIVIKVAELGGDVVGFTKLSFAEKPWGLSCEVNTLVVAEGHRKRGVGAALMEAAASVGREHGCKGIRADVLLGNDDAVRFYERLGYEATSIRHAKSL